MKRFWKWWQTHTHWLRWFFLGMGLLFFATTDLRQMIVSRQLSSSPPPVFERMSVDQSHLYPLKITIESLAEVPEFLVEAPVELGYYRDGEWSLNRKSALYLASSAVPSTEGNTIIYGHNTWPVFNNLDLVEGGEIVQLELENGQIETYQIYKIEVLDPEQVESLKQTSTAELTIYTCAGWLDSKRLVVKAKPVYQSAG